MFSYSLAADGTPGFAGITDRFVALLGGVTPAVVSDLFAVMSATDATIDDLLDIASSRGVSDFAIVELITANPVAVAIAASGNARVEIDGASSTTIAGPPGATWVIGRAKEIRSLVMSLGEAAPGTARLPIERGVVPADSILIDQSVRTRATPTPAHPATMPITLPRLESLPAVAGVLQDASTPGRVLVALPDGNRLDPATPVILGRRPWDNATEDPSRYHVAAPSPLRQISARHLLLDTQDGQLVAHDLNSTNGTIMLRFGRPPRLIHGGSSTTLEAGDVLDLGESYRVTIVRA